MADNSDMDCKIVQSRQMTVFLNFFDKFVGGVG